jgi:hypothetical protein
MKYPFSGDYMGRQVRRDGEREGEKLTILQAQKGR